MGTGTYGKCIYSNLCNEGFHDKIECFIVSSKPEVSQIDDKSVVMIEQLEEFEEKKCNIASGIESALYKGNPRGTAGNRSSSSN